VTYSKLLLQAKLSSKCCSGSYPEQFWNVSVLQSTWDFWKIQQIGVCIWKTLSSTGFTTILEPRSTPRRSLDLQWRWTSMLLNFKHSHVLHIVENTQARSPPLCLHKLVISLLCHWRGLIQTGPDSPRNWVLIIYLLKFKNWKCCGFLYFNLSYYVSMFEWQDNQKSQELGDFSIHFYLYPFPVYSVKRSQSVLLECELFHCKYCVFTTVMHLAMHIHLS